MKTKKLFRWSAVNEQLMHKLLRLGPYFENKVVLELGAGFGIGSILSLYLGAKHVFITDGDPELVAVIPSILERNGMTPECFTVRQLVFGEVGKIGECSTSSDIEWIITECRRRHNKDTVGLMVAADVLDSHQTARSFFKSISFLFERYHEDQRLLFRNRKQREMESVHTASSIQSHFARFPENKMDINCPITTGGVLPSTLRPQRRNTVSPTFNSSANRSAVHSVHSGTPSADSVLRLQNHVSSTSLFDSIDAPSETSLTSFHSLNSSTSFLTNTGSRSGSAAGSPSWRTRNLQLPNTVHLYPDQTQNDMAPAPPAMSSMSSRSAIERVVNVKPLEISTFDRVRYDALSQRNQQKQQNGRILPKLRRFDGSNTSNTSSTPKPTLPTLPGEYSTEHLVDREYFNGSPPKRRRLEMNKKEEDEFVAKSRENAPILILAHHKRPDEMNGLNMMRNDALSTFCGLCVEKGYRIQNVLFERDCEIWIVKA